MRIGWNKAASVGMAAALAAGCAAPAIAPRPGPQPVLDVDFPDPSVLPVGDGLFAYATNTRRDGRRINVQVSRSRDGASWTAPAEAMPDLPPWARRERPDVWAPEAMRIGARYVLYFSARHATRMRADGLTLCVGAAVATRPEGPFTPQPRPLTCGGEHGVIDASPFRDGDDLWLYVKTDGNCCGATTTFQAWRLAPDGLGVAGAPTTLRGIANDRPWEGGVVEAPQMLKIDGRYRLFYAGNDYGGARYATGYAACDGPTGPCRDARENPILRSGDGASDAIGPGHPGVFPHDGRLWIAYHGWRHAGDDRRRYRAMYVEALDWVDGRPVVAGSLRARGAGPVRSDRDRHRSTNGR